MKTWVKKVFGFGLASFFSDVSHEMTIAFIPVLAAQFVGADRAPFFLGLIASLTGLFASILRIISGFISDRVAHKKPLIALGYGMSALFSTLAGFAHSIGGLLVYRMLSFAGSGLREPPRDALIAATIEPAYYGRAFGLRNGMDTLGALLGPLIAVACATTLSIREIFMLSFVPGLASVLAIIFLTRDIPVYTKTSKKISSSLMKDVLLLPRPFILFCIILFIFDIATFDKLLLLARTQEIMGDQTHIASLLVMLYAFFNITRACSEFVIGFLSDYINRILLLALLGCGTLIGVALLLIAPHATFMHGVAIFVIAGISAAAVLTLKKACAADMLPADIRGLGYGVLQASEGVAYLISNILIGFLWTHYSPLLGFSYTIFMSGIAMGLLIIFSIMQSRTTT